MTELDKLREENREIQATLSMLLKRLRRPLPDGMGWLDPVTSAREIVEENGMLHKQDSFLRGVLARVRGEREHLRIDLAAAEQKVAECSWERMKRAENAVDDVRAVFPVLHGCSDEEIGPRLRKLVEEINEALAAAEKERDEAWLMNARRFAQRNAARADADAGRRLLGEALKYLHCSYGEGCDCLSVPMGKRAFKACEQCFLRPLIEVYLLAQLDCAPRESEPSEVEGLRGAVVVKSDTFRSKAHINEPDDMMRLVIDLPLRQGRKIKSVLSPERGEEKDPPPDALRECLDKGERLAAKTREDMDRQNPNRRGCLRRPARRWDAPALRNVIALILPLAKGYAAAHPCDSSDEYLRLAQAALDDDAGEWSTPATHHMPTREES